ncbi:nuclear RNA export factor 1-like [Venturia canescens]|uniref:nuclear RNA export factor 1-like n=1 Tax=Venturia canescens TaxID=32260 RepID=UPI001C9CE423|nr:nuclear RNA export factor 1-like [Venturia canescens]XP_043289611.1 nuclear RNA export factor 1-like [Venturia canescens]
MNIEPMQDAGTASVLSSGPSGSGNSANFWDSARLSYTNPVLTNQDMMLITRHTLRHKFIIYKIGTYTKKQILDAVISACSPAILFPLMYTVESPNKASFIAKCTVAMIKQFVIRGLKITMPDDCTLGMDIILGYTNSLTINFSREINMAIKSRYDPVRKTLNLDNFENDKSLRNIYCATSSPRILAFILQGCSVAYNAEHNHNSKLSVRELSLRHNNLIGLGQLDKCFNYHLTKIDLRNNDIINMNELYNFKDFKIDEIWLDGNPLCSRFTNREDYVREVKAIFPHVQKLDGIMIGVETKWLPPIQMNYLNGFSKINLIKQFIRHFFTFYDQNDRIVMNGLYDHDALFSMTLGPITHSTHLQMTKAFANNRNLLKFVDYAKCQEFLLRGPDKIIAALRRQPTTVHDYRNFNVDLLFHTEDSVTIAVQGFFSYREYSHPPLFFNRTFVIVEIEDNEYCIANDQYHIQSDSSNSKSTSEAKLRPTVAIPDIKFTIFSRSEKEQLLRFLSERTTMNEEYCYRFLEQANWDIRVALGAFVKSYTVNDVPLEAFQRYTYS